MRSLGEIINDVEDSKDITKEERVETINTLTLKLRRANSSRVQSFLLRITIMYNENGKHIG